MLKKIRKEREMSKKLVLISLGVILGAGAIAAGIILSGKRLEWLDEDWDLCDIDEEKFASVLR